MSSTLVDRLRESVRACRAIDRSQLLEEAAAEIERLRLRLATDDPPNVAGSPGSYAKNDEHRCNSHMSGHTLTDAERAAVEWCRDNITAMAHPSSAFAHMHADTLRGLLERTK